MNDFFDVVIVGGGPAGLACALKTKEANFSTLIIEREEKLGGILKQCIHDGFGLIRYGERLTGPEYAYRDIKKIKELGVGVLTSSFVLNVYKKDNIFYLTITNEKGIQEIKSKTLVLATGCRERTAKQILIHGTRPSGIFTAGTVQNLINIQGLIPSKNAVILGSGDIGLIMARRLTLEGCKVLGVYEAKNSPSGLARNISQCLDDFNIPLYLSKTVTKVFGDDRLEAVEISDVDQDLNPIKGTEKIIKCDTLILSVGLIPENELAEKLNIKICPFTKGPYVDNNLMTSEDGVFSIGNSLSVNDLVDYVSQNGFIAAEGIKNYLTNNNEKNLIEIKKDENILSIVPQYINSVSNLQNVTFYIRSKKDFENKNLIFINNQKEILNKKFSKIHNAESIRVELNLENLKDEIEVSLK